MVWGLRYWKFLISAKFHPFSGLFSFGGLKWAFLKRFSNFKRHFPPSHDQLRWYLGLKSKFGGENFLTSRNTMEWAHKAAPAYTLADTQHIKTIQCHQCNFCDKMFRDKIGLSSHTNSVHLNHQIEYELCGFKAFNKTQVKEHIPNIHVWIVQTCEICKRTFYSLGSLSVHMNRVYSDKPKDIIFADHCDKSFTTIHGLKNHENCSR